MSTDIEKLAAEQYEDAVRLDAFAPDDARQAFLEGYVRAALANYRVKVALGLDSQAEAAR